ncbi:GNAT family N-acetyltransferase [Butyrivibrio proteoclasticus]|uniref:GNAT family N-acetyltransferase n=1 Tax=Butyrivibrio proteoclasticus TaxID=43305 RepID=UPI00047B61C7|nr:GNAT family N-acetyltransferase [Butyrivibrio proteoclasticus]
MEYEVRNAQGSDYKDVKRIMNQVQNMHVEWRPDIYRPNEDMITEDIFKLMVGSGNLYVATIDDKVVGVLEINHKHIETPAHVTRDIIFIDSMAVDENYRGQGIGHLFFDKVKEIKKETNADGIELQVNAKNKAAYKMYSKCGFTEKSINMELLS